MEDTGRYHATNNPNGWTTTITRLEGNFTVAAASGQNTVSTLGNLTNVTTIEEGGKFELEVVVDGNTNQTTVVALQVRTATNSDNTSWSSWQDLDQECWPPLAGDPGRVRVAPLHEQIHRMLRSWRFQLLWRLRRMEMAQPPHGGA